MKINLFVFFVFISTNANAALNAELSAWLDAHPNVKANMVWSGCSLTQANTTHCATHWGDGSTCSCLHNAPLVSYDDWPIEMKELLHSAYQMRINNQFVAVPDPPPFMGAITTGVDSLSQDSVRQIYIAHLAQTFWWEIHDGRWSMTTLNDDGIKALLSAVTMFGRAFTGGYKQPGSAWQEPVFELPNSYPVTPGDPAYSFRYLKDRKLIGDTRRETIVRVLDWARTQAIHSQNPHIEQSRLSQWQYQGAPPVSRILAGTQSQADPRKISRVPGCHGFTELLSWLLRTVNIPVGVLKEDLDKLGHSPTYFISEDLFLSHGDDYKLPPPVPTAAVKVSTDPFSGALVFGSPNEYDMSCLFIDRKTHDEWFLVATRAEALNHLDGSAGQCQPLNTPGAPTDLGLTSPPPPTAGGTAINGRNVTRVDFANGWFAQIGNRQWVEYSPDGGQRFTFSETVRDDWSVLLNDPSRNVQLQLDLHRNWITFGQNGGARSDLYPITAASAEDTMVNGVNVTRVDFANGWFAKTGNGQWAEYGPDGTQRFTFSETARDEWSVYLNDASRNVQLQLDLHRNWITFGQNGGAESDLYPITSSSK